MNGHDMANLAKKHFIPIAMMMIKSLLFADGIEVLYKVLCWNCYPLRMCVGVRVRVGCEPLVLVCIPVSGRICRQ